MERKANFLTLILLDALEDEDEKVLNNILSKYKVDPSFVQQERGISPLHYACGMPNYKLGLEMIRRFLECSSDVNARTQESMTPLHVAAMYGRIEIVKMLLQHGAELEVYDDERKSPVLYAIEECHFEVVQLMRDHIFEHKYERKQQQQQQYDKALISNLSLEESLQRRPKTTTTEQPASTPHHNQTVNKNLLAVKASAGVENKYTPNKRHYNYDVTSPYYINITHRRHRVQPIFPEESLHSSDSAVDSSSINIFTLTKENLSELTKKTPLAESSRLSVINTWREKVNRSRARASILQQFDNVDEMIDKVMQHDHLNFTNTVLRTPNPQHDVDSGACGSSSVESLIAGNSQCAALPESKSPNIPKTNKMSLGMLIRQVAQAQIASPEPESKSDSSYETAPEVITGEGRIPNDMLLQVPDADTSNFIRSPKSTEYFLQMTEAYVHTDDENGMVFYETKFVRNSGNKIAKQRNADPSEKVLETTVTSQSTNLTLPFDYETDELRAELTAFGERPGPITKSTKRLYIKRLIKYKRKTVAMLEQQKKNNKNSNEIKFSVELYRTVRSPEAFQRISELMTFESQSSQFFANNRQKKLMREGHLKKSFIYMLIDPRISCNLPGESEYLDKFVIWRRFLQSIFYVGKGKTSRPYSHLYDAMKTYSLINKKQLNSPDDDVGKDNKISMKKNIDVELFKAPPKKTFDSKKLSRIIDIWGSGNGVVCLHVFHNIVPTDAYTREAAIIEALSLMHLTNMKRGDFYGPAQTWTMKERKYLGIALLYKAMQIFLAEGESQLSPCDLI